ncbi:MAG: GNAT family N-acetyltransferase [Paraglaciecola sp.]|uniref:GNAT family N-acetyltransferase n=1 Tax=Paraglaciecola sp. TaxID=1920173 RepID=UPI00329A0B60
MNLLTHNIDNLTRLWQAYGYYSKGGLQVNTNWPRKIWLVDPTSDFTTTDLKSISKHDASYKVALWPHTNNRKLKSYLSLETGSQLHFMSLMMTEYSPRNPSSADLVLQKLPVVNRQYIDTFVDVCSNGFGYDISPEVMYSASTFSEVSLYLLYQNNSPVATALTYVENGVCGIYQVSVPNLYRGKGYAKSMMIMLLNEIKKSDLETATLQASMMGLPLYANLGFQENGQLRFYALRH